MQQYFMHYSTSGFWPTPFGSYWVWGVVLTWVIIWKGLALWKAAGRKEKWWFVALLVINTIGILEILYLFVFSKSKKENIQP